MKHVTIASKSLLAGDEVVDLVIEYATLLAQVRSADSVEITAFAPDGDANVVTFLLNGGVTIVAESSHSDIVEPDNTKAEQYLHDRIATLRGAGTPPPEDTSGAEIWNAPEPE